MKLWIGVVVVVVFLVLILIIVGIVKSKNKKKKEEEMPVEESMMINPATGDKSIHKGRMSDKFITITPVGKPLMERIQEDCDNWTDKDAAERLQKIRELYNIEK